MTDSPRLNIVFAGTPHFAAVHLEALINSQHNIIGVYTQPDRPSGRGKTLTASPVKQTAIGAGIPVFQPDSLKTEQAQHEFASLNADILVVVAYGLILPKAVLDTPKFGCINVHASLLPSWRGAAPIQRAIEAGDTQTGITIMQMDEGLDTGDMLNKTYCDITPADTAASLHDKLADIGPASLLATIEDIALGKTCPVKQNNSHATYAAKLLKEEATIDWSLSATIIERRIRAFNPFPVSNSLLFYSEGAEPAAKVKIYQAAKFENDSDTYSANAHPGQIIHVDKKSLIVACGEGTLGILKLQMPGKKPIDVSAFINGFKHQLTNSSHFGLPK